MAKLDDLLALDLRVGTIVAAEELRGARRPTLVLSVDFGSAGVKRACVDAAGREDPSDLVGLQVAAVLNLVPQTVAGVEAEARVLSADDGAGQRVLLLPERPLADGGSVIRGGDEE